MMICSVYYGSFLLLLSFFFSVLRVVLRGLIPYILYIKILVFFFFFLMQRHELSPRMQAWADHTLWFKAKVRQLNALVGHITWIRFCYDLLYLYLRRLLLLSTLFLIFAIFVRCQKYFAGFWRAAEGGRIWCY